MTDPGGVECGFALQFVFVDRHFNMKCCVDSYATPLGSGQNSYDRSTDI